MTAVVSNAAELVAQYEANVATVEREVLINEDDDYMAPFVDRMCDSADAAYCGKVTGIADARAAIYFVAARLVDFAENDKAIELLARVNAFLGQLVDAAISTPFQSAAIAA